VLIGATPALLPVVGLKALHLDPLKLGFVYTCMGLQSLVGAVFVLEPARKKRTPKQMTVLSGIVLAASYAWMAIVRQPQVFFIVSALAGLGWTLSASELWVAAQRAMPSWARGRLNATVIMISQGAMAFGGLVWSSAAAVAGPIHALFGATVLFLVSLLLAGRLSINVRADPEQKVSCWIALFAGFSAKKPI
jgi:Transmembrane secretion effector